MLVEIKVRDDTVYISPHNIALLVLAPHNGQCGIKLMDGQFIPAS